MDEVDFAETADLCCPDCGGSLTESHNAESASSTPDRTADEFLVCRSCNHAFPVIAGIARFVEQQHLASFGLQWNKYDVAHDAEDRATFLAKTGVDLAELRGLRVLDAGCGGGRYSKLVTESGAILFAADHSTAVEKAIELCQRPETAKFVQADLKRLPFPPESFDFAFSIGVMHHDADTRAVFDAVARMVKPGGRLAVWLYRRNQWWQEA
ncbi:MAG: methyltransferase domain-containing protein, partial [Planctomycetota bacterium]|nr:methyltransferase domain-containing protein [Planctomycetota bacterium]